MDKTVDTCMLTKSASMLVIVTKSQVWYSNILECKSNHSKAIHYLGELLQKLLKKFMAKRKGTDLSWLKTQVELKTREQ